MLEASCIQLPLMKILNFKDKEYGAFVKRLDRRAVPEDSVRDLVAQIIEKVSLHGDEALISLTEQFDGAKLTKEQLFVSEQEFAEAAAEISQSTKNAVERSLKNIHLFAEKSKRKDWMSENTEGALVGERFTPFDRVGVYVPGGKAPLVSTALMTAGFAQAIGVPQIFAASPCNKEGKLNPALLYALQQAGVTEVIKVGGAQAIAAMALGTESISPVDRIFGPGNRFVVEAKRQLVGAISIDLLPGPSEILILADETAQASYIAADLLAQAEHGGDSVVGFLTTSQSLLEEVIFEVNEQALRLDRKEIIQQVLETGTFLLLVESMEKAIEITNQFAPEHLSLIVEEEEEVLSQIRTAGAIYLGADSPVAVGDFLAGPSHTLPTGGAGKSFSGLRADQFQRRTSLVRMDKKSVGKSLELVNEFARIEGLDAHGKSVSIRMER